MGAVRFTVSQLLLKTSSSTVLITIDNTNIVSTYPSYRVCHECACEVYIPDTKYIVDLDFNFS